MSKPFCRKCLLEEYDPDNALTAVREILAAMPDKLRVNEQEYRRRLQLCTDCEQLLGGVCGMCGCYVELRAGKKSQHCPHSLRRW